MTDLWINAWIVARQKSWILAYLTTTFNYVGFIMVNNIYGHRWWVKTCVEATVWFKILLQRLIKVINENQEKPQSD